MERDKWLQLETALRMLKDKYLDIVDEQVTEACIVGKANMSAFALAQEMYYHVQGVLSHGMSTLTKSSLQDTLNSLRTFALSLRWYIPLDEYKPIAELLKDLNHG